MEEADATIPGWEDPLYEDPAPVSVLGFAV